MSEHKIFKAFFSYAHHDADTDPGLVPAFTTALEKRVNAKLVNARFAIWRDQEGLRVGHRWDAKMEAELRGADVLIVLLTPRWVESDYCRKEYMIFEAVEATREIGEYVAPILVRTIERQEKHFTQEQKNVYERVKSRQHQVAIATEFMMLSEAGRTALIDRIADDIEGMIERRRVLPSRIGSESHSAARARKSKEFDSRAQNYERVDFLTGGEVVLNQVTDDGQRDVLAHVGFIERLYVQGKRGRIEFGVRRAFMSIRDGGSRISKIDDLKSVGDHKTHYYTTLHEAPDAVTVCIDPPAGKSSLAELPLPPAKNENYLSKVAVATADLKAGQIKADLIVLLNAEGLYLNDGHVVSPRIEAAIKTIMDVARAKIEEGNNQTIERGGQLRRSLPVRERP